MWTGNNIQSNIYRKMMALLFFSALFFSFVYLFRSYFIIFVHRCCYFYSAQLQWIVCIREKWISMLAIVAIAFVWLIASLFIVSFRLIYPTIVFQYLLTTKNKFNDSMAFGPISVHLLFTSAQKPIKSRYFTSYGITFFQLAQSLPLWHSCSLNPV